MTLLSRLGELFPPTHGPWWEKTTVVRQLDKKRPSVRILDFSRRAYTHLPTFGDILLSFLPELKGHLRDAQKVVVVFDSVYMVDRLATDNPQHSIPNTNLNLDPASPEGCWRIWAAHNSGPNSKGSVSADLKELGGIPAVKIPFMTTTCPANWKGYLQNVDFWLFLHEYLADGLSRLCKVPEGKQLLVVGPGNKVRGSTSAGEFKVDPALTDDRHYYDAALTTVWLTEYFEKYHDVTIFSNNDRVILAQLLAQPRRILTVDFVTLNFNGCVSVATGWVHFDREFTLISIDRLFSTIVQHSKLIPGVDFTPAVSTWVFLILLCCESQKCVFPRLHLTNLLKFLPWKMKELEHPLVQNVNSEADVRVNCSAWLHYIFLSYQQSCAHLSLDYTDMEDCFAQIRSLLASDRDHFTLAKFKIRLANAFWLFRCMIAAQDARRFPDPLEVSLTESVFGYEEISTDKLTGRMKVGFPEDVTLRHMDFPPRVQAHGRDSSPKRRSSSD